MSIPHPTPSHPSLPNCFILLILPPTLPPYPSHGYHQPGTPHGYLGQHLCNLCCFGLGAVPLPTGSRGSIQTALRTLLAAPWPSQRDVRSWLQLLSVLQWVLSFLLLGEWGAGGGGVPVGQERARLPPSLAPAGTVSLLLLIYLVFTSFWPISALYLAWIIFDWDTPEKGGDGRSPPFLQLCRRMESGVPPFFGSIPAWQMGSTMSHLLFPSSLPSSSSRWEEGCGGSRGASPTGPAAHWGGHHLLWSILGLQVEGGCRACGNGPSGGTFGIISP